MYTPTTVKFGSHEWLINFVNCGPVRLCAALCRQSPRHTLPMREQSMQKFMLCTFRAIAPSRASSEGRVLASLAVASLCLAFDQSHLRGLAIIQTRTDAKASGLRTRSRDQTRG